jgi:7-cyano-7-deazaguanine synthase in queuosine biosynthesis/organic radical activating enzyme
MKRKAILLLSGGFDSVATYYLMRKEYELICINYTISTLCNIGEKFAINKLREKGATVIERDIFANLTDGQVRLKNATEESVLKTYVPNRNAYFLLDAMNMASSMGIDRVFFSATGEQGLMPDADQAFVTAIEEIFNSTTKGNPVFIEMPLVLLDKVQIFEALAEKNELHNVLDNSVSCFNGTVEKQPNGIRGCGKCGKCETNNKALEFYKLRSKYGVTELIEASFITFEITRRCNMRCPHCFKGDAQNKDLSLRYIDIFLAHFRYVDFIAISGGEPFLAKDRIIHIFKVLKATGIRVPSVTMHTNGAFSSSEDIAFVRELNAFSDELNIELAIVVSDDQYHEKVGFDKLLMERNVVRYSEFDYKTSDFMEGSSAVVKDGRAEENIPEATGEHFGLSVDSFEGDTIFGGFTITALGKVIVGNDFSYDKADNDKGVYLTEVQENNYYEKAEEYYEKAKSGSGSCHRYYKEL